MKLIRSVPARRFSGFILGQSFLVFLGLGCGQAPEPKEDHPAIVKLVSAQTTQALGEWSELLGTTLPLPGHTARISTLVEGRVVSILKDAEGKSVMEGQRVRAGDVVAQLDTILVRQQKKQAELAWKLADIEVQRLKALKQERPMNGQLPLVSQIEIDKANIALEDAKSKLKGLEEQLKLFTLVAPISGQLGLFQIVPGQTLAVGATVAEVIDLEEIDVLCFVPPSIAAKLALDQPVRLMAGEEPQDSSAPAGKIVYIAVQAQPETGNFPVKARFPNPKLGLRANQVVTVQARTIPEKDRITVPETVLMEDQDPPAVIVVQEGVKKDKDGKEVKILKARKLVVEIGVRDRSRHIVEILSLRHPDPENKEAFPVREARFVVEGGHGIQDDDQVKVEEEKKE